MRAFTIYFFVIIFFTSCNSKQLFVSTYQHDMNSNYNKGYKEGYEAGYNEGLQKRSENKYNEGLKKGIELGKSQGIVMGYEQFQLEHKDYYSKNPRILKEHLDKYAQSTLHRMWFDEGVIYARDTFYRMGYQDGYVDCFNNIDTINLRMGQTVERHYTDYKPKIDYNYILKQLKSIINLTYPYADMLTMNKIIRPIHMDVLNYLSIELGLSKKEKADLFLEYNRIHNDLVKSYYASYKRMYEATNVRTKQSKYNLVLHNTALIVFEVINSGLCSVADATITYAKKNSQYGRIKGLSIMGNICEVLQYNVLPEIRDAVLKLAIRDDYEELAPKLESTIKQDFQNLIIETRSTTQNIKEQKKVEKDYDASINMDISTVVNLGLDTSLIDISLDHKAGEIIINISDQPVIMGLFEQNYEVTKVHHDISYVEKIEKEEHKYSLFWFWKTPKPDSKNIETKAEKSVKIESSYFENMFNENKPTKFDEINDFKTKFRKDVIFNYRSILKQYFVTMVSATSSFYEVKLVFGSYKETLIKNEFL